MILEKINDQLYRITDGERSVEFSKEKFEDLYYAVPVNNTAFLRLLLDNICEDATGRHTINTMLDQHSERSAVLDKLQKQIQAMEKP
jgi:hypothetical protein